MTLSIKKKLTAGYQPIDGYTLELIPELVTELPTVANGGVVINDDGSVDVWFGPSAPEGHESNWVQTVPGKSWNTLLRLYGPEQSWFDKTWKPGDFVEVK